MTNKSLQKNGSLCEEKTKSILMHSRSIFCFLYNKLGGLSPNHLLSWRILNCFSRITFEGVPNRLYLYDGKQKLNQTIY